MRKSEQNRCTSGEKRQESGVGEGDTTYMKIWCRINQAMCHTCEGRESDEGTLEEVGGDNERFNHALRL